MPSAVKVYNGNVNKAIALSLISNILSILSIPVLLCLVTEKTLELNFITKTAIEIGSIILPRCLWDSSVKKFW